jgi:hypothetical protein
MCRAIERALAHPRPLCAPRPLPAALLDPMHVALGISALLLLLVFHAIVFAPLLLFVDVVAVAIWLADPSRRTELLRRTRCRRQHKQALQLRGKDREHWVQLQCFVTASRSSLSSSRHEQLEELLDLYVEIGVDAARCEAHIDRLGWLPGSSAASAPLLSARSQRRQRALLAMATLDEQLATLSTLVQLGCEDGAAACAMLAASSAREQVEELRRSAELAMAATDELSVNTASPAPFGA